MTQYDPKKTSMKIWMAENRDLLLQQAIDAGITFRTEDKKQALHKKILAELPKSQNLNVFAYGSLMWNPDNDVQSTKPAILKEYHRSFCLDLPIGRGSKENPGLMLGLIKDCNQSCQGLMQVIAAKDVSEALTALLDRECTTESYMPTWVALEIDGDKKLPALAFIVNENQPRYLKHLSIKQKAVRLASAEGPLGKNRDYLFELAKHLKSMSTHDEEIEALAKLVFGE